MVARTTRSPSPLLILENVQVIDVMNGKVVGPRTVLVGDGRIAAIKESGEIGVPPGARTFDGSGKYLIPGLMDLHVHLFNHATKRPPNDWMFPLFVANGVTGVREMNAQLSDMPALKGWRTALERGELRAPRIVAAGLTISADSTEAAREQVRKARATGFDFIKIFSELPEPQWRAVLNEASQLGMPVCGHIPAQVSLLDAASAGQKSNEHLSQFPEACSAREKQFLAGRRGLSGEEAVKLRDAQERQVLFDFNPQLCRRVIAELAGMGQVQVPTLVLPHFEARVARTQFRDDPHWQLLRPDEQERWRKALEGEPADAKTAAERWAVSREIVRTLSYAGVRILAGTDTPMPLVYPGFSLHKELELLVEVGLTPADALRTATLWPAEFLGLSGNSGSIESGKQADLVLLDGDPLRDITNTQRIHAVVLDGRLLERADLDALLQGPHSPQSPVETGY